MAHRFNNDLAGIQVATARLCIDGHRDLGNSPGTSRCRSFASNVSFPWTRRPPARCAAGLLSH